MARTARGIGDALGHQAVARRREVWAADADVRGFEEARGQIPQPVRIGVGVVVDVRNDIPRRRMKAHVPGVAQAVVAGTDDPEPVFARDGGSVVSRPVVDDDHLEARVVQAPQALEAVADRTRPVVGAHDDRHPRQTPVLREGRLEHRLPDSGQGRLGSPVATGETEVPVLDVEAASVPLVGPAEHEAPRRAGGERGAHLPAQRSGLRRHAVPPTVEPDLRHDQGTVAGEVLKAREIRRQAPRRLEIHVEADQVDEGQLEVFGGRIVDVGDQRGGILGPGHVTEPRQELLHAAATVPAHDWGRDLVPDRVAEDGGMPGAAANASPDALRDGRTARAVVEEGDVLLPGQADHHAESVALGQVEQPPGGYGVRADGVEAVGGDRGEVTLRPLAPAVLVAAGIGPEGAVRDSADPELFVA